MQRIVIISRSWYYSEGIQGSLVFMFPVKTNNSTIDLKKSNFKYRYNFFKSKHVNFNAIISMFIPIIFFTSPLLTLPFICYSIPTI